MQREGATASHPRPREDNRYFDGVPPHIARLSTKPPNGAVICVVTGSSTSSRAIDCTEIALQPVTEPRGHRDRLANDDDAASVRCRSASENPRLSLIEKYWRTSQRYVAPGRNRITRVAR